MSNETWRRMGNEDVWVNSQTFGRIVSVKPRADNAYAVSLPNSSIKIVKNRSMALKKAKLYMKRNKYG